MTPGPLPGSWFLQACFYLLTLGVIIAAAAMVERASRHAGDSPAAAAALRRRFLIGSAAWTAVVGGASFAGLFLPREGPPLPFGILLTSILALGVLVARSTAGDRLARGAPLAALVGLQAFRFPLELAMHRAYTEGLMPEQMSYSGRNFDVVTGVTALLLSAALAVTRVPIWVVWVWNILGLALLVNIVTVAIMSTPLVAYFGPQRLNVFVMRMPYTLLPAVLVLAAWAGHLVVFRALNSPAASRPDPR